MPDYIEFTWDSHYFISASRIVSGYYIDETVQDAIRDFKLQYYQDGQWTDIPGTNVSYNYLSDWFGTFAPARTDKIRLVVLATHQDISRIWEIEFYHPIADLNNDGKVDLSDFAIIGLNWLLLGPDLDGDLEENGMVDIEDLSYFNEFWTWP